MEHAYRCSFLISIDPTKSGNLHQWLERHRSQESRHAAPRPRRARTGSPSWRSTAWCSAIWQRPARCSGRPRRHQDAPYEVRVCSLAPQIASEHVSLAVPWRLSSCASADTVIVPGIDAPRSAVPRRAPARDLAGPSIAARASLHLQRRLPPGSQRRPRRPARDHPLARRRRARRAATRRSTWTPACSTSTTAAS